MKITAEGRKSEDSNNKTIVNNVMGCLRALQGLSRLLGWTLIWTPIYGVGVLSSVVLESGTRMAVKPGCFAI